MADTFDKWFHSGRAAVVAWFILLVAYAACKILKINNVDEITNAFVGVTGLLIANLGFEQGRKSTQVSEDVNKLKEVAIKQHPEAAGDLDE